VSESSKRVLFRGKRALTASETAHLFNQRAALISALANTLDASAHWVHQHFRTNESVPEKDCLICQARTLLKRIGDDDTFNEWERNY